MSSDLQLFNNSDLGSVRVVMRDSEPWFVAKDVAQCISHSDPSAMCKLCREKDVATINGKEYSDDLSEYSGGRGNPNIRVISESGLYRILAKCNLPKCEPFESWVFDDVLPSIRKTGSYSIATQISETDTLMLQAFHCQDPLEYAGIMKRRDALVHKTELKRSMTAIGKLGGIQKARNIAIQERDDAKQALVEKTKELELVQSLYDEYKESIGEGQKKMSSAQLKANYPDKFGAFKSPSTLTKFLKRKCVPFKESDCVDKSGYRYAIFDVEKALAAIDKE